MTTLLYPPSSALIAPLITIQKRLHYPTILSDLVRAATDAVSALTLFSSLLVEADENAHLESINHLPGYMAFDGHIGDTSCQLRACMLRELVLHHRALLMRGLISLTGNIPTWIALEVSKLEQFIKRARETVRLLTVEKKKPSELGLIDAGMTRTELATKLGWAEDAGEVVISSCPLTSFLLSSADSGFASGRCGSSDCGDDESFGPGSDVSGTASRSFNASTPASTLSTLAPSPLNLDDVNRKLSIASHLPRLCIPDIIPIPPASSLEERAATAWSLTYIPTIIRFLTYNYTLSKYKRFCRLAHCIGARLEPDEAASAGARLVADVWDTKNPHYRGVAQSKRIQLEFQGAQAWVSEISCEWLEVGAKRLGKEKLLRYVA